MANLKTFTDKILKLKHLNSERIIFKKSEDDNFEKSIYSENLTHYQNGTTLKIKRKKLEKEIFNLINQL